MSIDLWPPPFTIRHSARSKRILLKISPSKGLEIVIPKKVSQKKAIEFLYLKKAWVQSHLHLCHIRSQNIIFPNSIQLKAINQVWTVNYAESIANRLDIYCDYLTHTLHVHNRNKDEKKCLDLIKKWLKAKAERYFKAWLDDYSCHYQLRYQCLRIRDHKSQWGSCSKIKNINLNYKLLFLPKELVHYVIIHELVHTIHFNHSEAFWTTLGRFLPNYISLRSQLKTIDQQLPNWLYY